MDVARVRALVILMKMGKVMAMTMAVPAVHPQIAPCGDGKPATKGNECEARDRVDDVAKAFCESDPRQPDDYRDEQCRERMCPLPARSAALAVSDFDQPRCRAISVIGTQ